jgi:hypothetical protein
MVWRLSLGLLSPITELLARNAKDDGDFTKNPTILPSNYLQIAKDNTSCE